MVTRPYGRQMGPGSPSLRIEMAKSLGMRTMLGENAEKTPLRRNVDQDDVARAALFLCSELGQNVTGETLHVDAGQNIMGVVSMG